MDYQSTFKRYEIKYLLSKAQKAHIQEIMAEYMSLDHYGRTTIRNIYYDTENYRLIRRSLEKPAYKEKLRIRSYQQAGPEDKVFVELKKKYQSVVYKRRLVLPEAEVMACFNQGTALPVDSQIGNEIEYFRQYYGNLQPAVFLTYEREAWFSKDGSDFRVTFDENILYRREEISLGAAVYGTPILHPEQTIMEIKTSGGMPLWMVKALSDQRIFKTSFSKYGTAFIQMMEDARRGGVLYA